MKLKLANVVLITLFMSSGARNLSEAHASEITNEQVNAVLYELRQIRTLLEKQQALTSLAAAKSSATTETAKIPLRNHYSLGSDDAPLTLVEFTDYQCPACNWFHLRTFPELKKTYIDTGKVRFISRDLPLEFHPHAFHAARAARCAGEQEKYWQLRDVVSSNPNHLDQDTLLAYAQEQSLDMQKFRTCLESHKYREEIQTDISDAHAAGVTGTPGFILGKTNKDVLEGIKLAGAKPYAVFDAKIRELLLQQP
jgi:protein-disulfide isomerase